VPDLLAALSMFHRMYNGDTDHKRGRGTHGSSSVHSGAGRDACGEAAALCALMFRKAKSRWGARAQSRFSSEQDETVSVEGSGTATGKGSTSFRHPLPSSRRGAAQGRESLSLDEFVRVVHLHPLLVLFFGLEGHTALAQRLEQVGEVDTTALVY
jgi:hypothetical protein